MMVDFAHRADYSIIDKAAIHDYNSTTTCYSLIAHLCVGRGC